MKKWAFVSDFDGTISLQDFYWIIIEKYYTEGREWYKRWKSGELQDIEFLSHIFRSINQPEATIREDIRQIPLDEHVEAFIKNVQDQGGDFYILSAGTDYYIKELITYSGLSNINVFSNKGYFNNNNIHLDVASENWHYSKRYGIDKAIVLNHIKDKYDYVFYYGDSEPDSHPAKYADKTFAREALISILKELDIPHVPVDNFKDVEQHLIQEGWLKDEKKN
ncbi:MtnX-like HAD-IB family phosphatase [Bacillus sp. A301a_S52]|nr:MtnX-like HAD-IB family phosphatase [Bacillus sp. A301a_S52]